MHMRKVVKQNQIKGELLSKFRESHATLSCKVNLMCLIRVLNSSPNVFVISHSNYFVLIILRSMIQLKTDLSMEKQILELLKAFLHQESLGGMPIKCEM